LEFVELLVNPHTSAHISFGKATAREKANILDSMFLGFAELSRELKPPTNEAFKGYRL